MRRFRVVVAVTCFLFATTSPVSADAGVPMIFITLPGMLAALLPIIVVETLVLARRLALPSRTVVKAAAASNAASTLVGIPVAWLVLVVLQMVTGGGGAYGISTPIKKLLAVTWQAPWLIPYESDLDWMIPAATGFLLVPFFLASWSIELRVNRWMLPDAERSRLRAATWDANLVSYVLLAVIVAGWLAAVLARRGA
jgi:hypothetical protein